MRALIWIMLPLLIVSVVLASRFVGFRSLQKADPEIVKYVVEGTRLLNASSDYGEAIDVLTLAIEKDPRHAIAFIRRGLAYYYLGEYDKAINDYNETLKLARYQADAYYCRGDAYQQLNNHQQAIKDYESSLKERWAAFVIWKRAETYLKIGESQRALQDYTEVIRRRRGAAAYYHRARAYVQLDKEALALKDFARAIEVEPEFAEAYLERGEIFERLGHREDAEFDYLKVVELSTNEIQSWKEKHSTLGPVYYRRGIAYEALGSVDKAMIDYETSIALLPNGALSKEVVASLDRVVAGD